MLTTLNIQLVCIRFFMLALYVYIKVRCIQCMFQVHSNWLLYVYVILYICVILYVCVNLHICVILYIYVILHVCVISINSLCILVDC